MSVKMRMAMIGMITALFILLGSGFWMACLATSTEEIDALGHNFVKDETSAVEPTCEDPGKMADMKCSRCTAVMTGEEIPALGHNYETVGGSAVAPACEAAGKETDVKCSRCGSVVEGNTLPALGHEWSEWTVAKEATGSLI